MKYFFTGWDVRGTVIKDGKELEIVEDNFFAHTVGQLMDEILKRYEAQRWKNEPYVESLGTNGAEEDWLKENDLEYLLCLPDDLKYYQTVAAREMRKRGRLSQ